MTVATRSRLAGASALEPPLREAPALVEHARMVKDEEEIACLRSAVILGASLFDVPRKRFAPESVKPRWRRKWNMLPAGRGRSHVVSHHHCFG